MIDSRTAAYGALVLRVALGVLALSHGLTKLLVFTPAGTVGFFASLGYPAFVAWFAMIVETVGGAALILGVYARVVARAADPGPARRHAGPSAERLDVRQPQWRLRVPAVLGHSAAGAGADWARCARPARRWHRSVHRQYRATPDPCEPDAGLGRVTGRSKLAMSSNVIDPAPVREYHAHVYFLPGDPGRGRAPPRPARGSGSTAASAAGTTSRLGRIRAACTRSCSRPSCSPELVPWLMLNRVARRCAGPSGHRATTSPTIPRTHCGWASSCRCDLEALAEH